MKEEGTEQQGYYKVKEFREEPNHQEDSKVVKSKEAKRRVLRKEVMSSKPIIESVDVIMQGYAEGRRLFVSTTKERAIYLEISRG